MGLSRGDACRCPRHQRRINSSGWNLLAESGVAIEVSAWTLVAFFAGVVVHELIHGLVWSFFCKDGLHSIHFGFQLKTLTPYCHCAQPLDKGGYIAGTLAPGVV